MTGYTDIATRASVLALKAADKTTAEVAYLTGLSQRQVQRILARAIARGFDPQLRPLTINDTFVEDAPKSGRPKKQTTELHDVVQLKVRGDRYGRERSCADLAGDLRDLGYEVSKNTVWRILRASGFRKTKPTRKPGLTTRMKEERLDWCKSHAHWTLDDWKNVIWSDETSVVLLHRRGGYRIWRTKDERFQKSCIRERWKGACEFMFWGCYTYDLKGPCHCWGPETAQEKKAADEAIDALNCMAEPALREQWELSTQLQRLNLRPRKTPGRKPQWRFTRKTGKLTRGSGKGIDWWRYREKILLPKLFPFAKVCMENRPGTVVQEDKAPAHAHPAQQLLYDLHGIRRLFWCGNSPDLNMIEPAWPYLKRFTTKKGGAKNRPQAIADWKAAWEALSQDRIRAWIERIPFHVQEVIRLEGGNEYQEGREKVQG